MPKLKVAPVVGLQLKKIHNYIAVYNPTAAVALVQATEETFERLAKQPGLGHPRSFGDDQFKGMQVHAIFKFENYLVFYREIPEGIHILRVYHRAQDIPRRLLGNR